MIHIEKNKIFFPFLMLKLPNSFLWTFGLIIGIIFSHLHIWPLFFFTCASCLAIKILPPKSPHFLFFIILGYGLYNYQTQSKLPSPVLKDVVIAGKISDKTFADSSFWKHRTQLDVYKIKTDNGWLPTSFSLYIYSKDRIYGHIQDTIECGPLTIKAPSDKEFTLYLQREGISATCFTQKINYKIIKRPKFSFLNWLFWQRELLQIKLRKKLSYTTFSLFSSLFMGNRKPVSSALTPHKQHFKKWGILHHLARSGLHLVVFIMIWHYLLNVLPLSFVYKHMVISGLITFYFLFSWSSLSFLRAFIVYALYKLSTLADTKTHPLHIICTACLVLLIHNPFHLFFLDFQLSFLLSFLLLWIAHIEHQRNITSHKSLAEKNVKTLS